MRAVSPHPNLIEFFGDCAVKVGDGYAYYILMELCTVQLSQLMAQRNSLPWNDSEVVHIFSQVRSHFLHFSLCAHNRDESPKHCVLNRSNRKC
jgi:hypothetical protein